MRYLIAVCVMLFGLSSQLKAAESCESCTAEQMFAVGQTAVVKGAWNAPHPPVYVTNFTDGVIVKIGYGHNVDQYFDWENDIFYSWGINMSVEPYALEYMAAMHAAMPPPINLSSGASVAARGMARATASGTPGSVYESISTPAYDGAISDVVNDHASGLKQVFVDWLKVFNPIPNFNPNAAMPAVRVNFEDGTYAFYEWDITVSLWKRKRGSARDKFGNIIPEATSDVAGDGVRNYQFPNGGGAELAQFLYRLSDLGISVSTQGGSGTRTRVGCSSAGNEPPICYIMTY